MTSVRPTLRHGPQRTAHKKACCGHDSGQVCESVGVYWVVLANCSTCYVLDQRDCGGHRACVVHAHRVRQGQQASAATGAPVLPRTITATYERETP